jgi:hypothetical protein
VKQVTDCQAHARGRRPAKTKPTFKVRAFRAAARVASSVDLYVGIDQSMNGEQIKPAVGRPPQALTKSVRQAHGLRL